MSEKKILKFRKEPEPTKEPAKAAEPIKTNIEIPQQPKPRDVSQEIQTLIQAYNGDLGKVQEFVIENFNKREIFDAGFQICLILTNDRLARENALREILDNVRHNRITLPFDPRDDPVLVKLIKRVIAPYTAPFSAQVLPSSVTQPPQRVNKTEEVPEDYTTSEEQRLAEIHALLDQPKEATK